MDISTILTRKYPGQEWTLNAGDYNQLTWLSDTPKPTREELENLWPIVQQEIVDEKQARIDAKASAIAKLEKLGLNAEEVKELFGIEV